ARPGPGDYRSLEPDRRRSRTTPRLPTGDPEWVARPPSAPGSDMDLLAQARAGFAAVDADPALKDKALANLTAWLTRPDFAAYRPQLEWLVRSARWSVLVDSFYQVMPFGTGGRRGAVGIGPNRMNLRTLGARVQGHCEYLRERFPDARELHVALAYDVRRFQDRNKKYDPNLPNPVLCLSSRGFAQAHGS